MPGRLPTIMHPICCMLYVKSRIQMLLSTNYSPLYIISLGLSIEILLCAPHCTLSFTTAPTNYPLGVSAALRHLTNNVAKALHLALSQTCQRLHLTGLSLPCRCDVTAKAAKQRWIRPEQTTNKKKEFHLFISSTSNNIFFFSLCLQKKTKFGCAQALPN